MPTRMRTNLVLLEIGDDQLSRKVLVYSRPKWLWVPAAGQYKDLVFHLFSTLPTSVYKNAYGHGQIEHRKDYVQLHNIDTLNFFSHLDRQKSANIAIYSCVLPRITNLSTAIRGPTDKKFNCVAVDLRLHGLTTSDPLPKGYSAKDTAEDVALFMDTIKLPACHIVGLSMGSTIAISLAVYYLNQVASLFLVSPLGLEEPADVADGRWEIAEYWREAFKTDDPDMAAISDSVYGAHQLGFNNNLDDLVNALTNISIPLVLKNCVPGSFEQYDRAVVGFISNRKEYTNDQFSRISAPVKLVHCLGSIAYPQEYSEKFMQQLKDAAVNVSLATIPEAPHFGVVTHGDIVNRLLYAFIIDSWWMSVPPAPQEVSSPWEAELAKAGWKKSGNDPEDD